MFLILMTLMTDFLS